MSRKKGLMARALEQSCIKPNFSKGSTETIFDNSIEPSKSNKSFCSNGFKNYHNKNSNNNKSFATVSSTEPTELQESHISGAINNKLQNEALILNRDHSFSAMSPCTSPTPPTLPPSEIARKRKGSQTTPSDGLEPIIENEQTNEQQFLSTQHLRSGFFRTIKKQYPNLGLTEMEFDNSSEQRKEKKEKEKIIFGVNSISNERNLAATDNRLSPDKSEEEIPFMSSMAQKRLKELRKIDLKKVDVTTGLQWIRLELHEMREQDKALFLQLIKLNSTIKEIRNQMKFIEESYDSSIESIDSAASYWWPRCNEASVLPDFSSSDGAHLLSRRNRPLLRRGFSLNHPPSQMMYPPNLSKISSGSLQSRSSSLSCTHSETKL